MTPDDERLDKIAQSLGLRGLEDVTCEPNENAPDGYAWGCWLGQFESGCKVGSGRTRNEATEDLLDQLGDK